MMKNICVTACMVMVVGCLIMLMTACDKVSTFPTNDDDDNTGPPGNQPPETIITSGPNGVTINEQAATFTWTGTDDQTPPGQLVFSYKIDNAQWSIFAGTTQRTFQNLADGNHTFMVKARDAHGAIDPSPAIAQFTVSSNGTSSAPDTQIIEGPPSNHTSDTATFRWTGYDQQDAPEALTFSYKLDGDAWSPFSNITTRTYTGIVDGSHLFQVKARNRAGLEDPTPATWAFTVSTSRKGVKLSAATTTLEVAGGDFALFNSTITNTGTNTDDFRVTLDDSGLPSGWIANLCKDGTCFADKKIDFNLGPGVSDTFEPDVSPVFGAPSGASGNIIVMAQSLTDPSVTDSLTLTVRVP